MNLPLPTSHPRPPRRPRSAWERLARRLRGLHRLPVNTTGEDDWQVEVPQIRMSRAFAVMLLLHIVAVGGLFAFHIWGRDEDPATTTADRSASGATDEAATSGTPAPLTGDPSAAVADSALAPNVSATTAAQTYAIHAGDTKPLIAARFGVAVADIEDANPDKPFAPGVVYTIPRPRRVITATDDTRDVLEPAPVFDPSAPVPADSLAGAIPDRSEIPDALNEPASTNDPDGTPVRKAIVLSEAEPEPRVTLPAKAKAKITPKLKPQPAAKGPEPKLIARAAGQRTHVVANGDTVFNVARRYGFTAEEVMKTNGIGNDYRIRLGQVLKIPVKR